MRYLVEGLEIRSENAAKPPGRASGWMLRWIDTLPGKGVALDYGCGKLRYTSHLCSKFGVVHGVDSHIQLTRKQLLGGSQRTLVEYARELLPNLVLHAAEESTWRQVSADLVVCTNVLSAIPSYQVRIEVLQALKHTLAPGGQILVSVQHTNSYYSSWRRCQGVQAYEGGFLIRQGAHRASYYAPIALSDLESHIVQAGLSVHKSLVEGQSSVVIAGRDRLGEVAD